MADADYVPFRPLWLKVQEGEKLTFTEALNYWLRAPIITFSWRVRITPKMRERCVDYALRGGASGYNVASEAQRLANYIAKGRL